MFEFEVFRKQMYCIEESILVTLLGVFDAPITIQHPGNCAPFPPLVTPLIDTRIGEANAVLRELFRSVVTKREVLTIAKM